MARKSRSTPRAVLFLFIAALSLLVGTAGAAPEAAFISNVTGGPAPLTVQFNDTSTGDPDGWTWYFGDETYGGEWTCVNTSSGWTARTSHTSVALPDGSILLIGGEDDSDRLNDAWRSVDGGVIWELVNASSGWTERIYHTCVALPDGNIVLMGGYDHIGEWLGGPKNDIWQSVDGGATWKCVNASSGWMARSDHTSVMMPDGSIVLMGGMFASPWWCLNDTWRSTDGGITWICVNESSGWMARSGHTTVALPDGSILLMGGVGGVGAANTFLNDIWKSTDGGEHWVLVNANSGWTARTGHSTVALADGSIVLMGGLDRDMNHLNDTWRSTDRGITWMQLPDAGWTARVDHTCVTMPDGSVILMGGFDVDGSARNDTWRFQPAGSSHQNPTHTYTVPGTYTVTLQAYNDDGHNVTQKVGYITVTPPPPEAGFTASVTSGTAPLTVKFTDQSTNNPTTWKWDFGDGETSTEENPMHTYAVPDTYTVTLTVWNGGGSNTHTDSITVTPPAPEAKFSATPLSGTAPLTVQFTDESTGDPTGWAWYFGDETYEGPWEQVNESAWPKRLLHDSVALPDGSIVIMGGIASGSTRVNDTWRSTDRGATWTQLPDANWTVRNGHAAVALPDGSIVLMGGVADGSKCQNDTWRSDDYGASWTLMNASSGWMGRSLPSSVVMPDGSIILMGGSGDEYLNDTWRSADRGATWTQVAEHAEWTARYGQAAVALPDGSIVLTGGEESYEYLNDTWRSTDGGATWTQVTEHAEWTGRRYHTAVAVPDGSIVLMGGNGGKWQDDVWRSTDGGATWTLVNASAWPARSMFASVVMPDGSIIIMGGLNDGYRNDVWRLQPAGSTVQNPTHTYTVPGTYTVTLQAYNDFGFDSIRKSITVTPPSSGGGGGGGGSTAGSGGGYNVGGDSAVSTVTATGTGLNMLIVTGWVQSSPGTDIPPAPGTPYQYIELTPARFEEITGANITFTVPAAWLAEQGFTPGGIVLYRYNGTAWEALPTWVVDDAGTTVTFGAASPGFSLFAISGIEQTTAVTTPTVAETATQTTVQPTATETTVVPVGDAAPDFPLRTVALIAGGVLVLAGAGYFIRRWWIRRQNPALFRDYD